MFQTDVEQISIGEEVVLREAKSEDKQLLAEMVKSGLVTQHALPKFGFALETTLLSPERTIDMCEASERFARAVTALRLLKSGAFGLPLLLAFQTESRALRSALFPFRPRIAGQRYSLEGQDAAQLNRISQSLSVVPPSHRYSMALRRFEMAYERWLAEDRLIDYWVALEALFLPDGPPQELRYRASLRVAWFVAQGPGEREEIFRQIRDSYDARSGIVHGRNPKDVPSISQFTEDVLRRALRKAVATPGSLDPQQLDSLIVRGS